MYGKIFEQIFDGSLRMNWKALITFQQMIILCNADGVIDMTHETIHFRTGIPLEIIKEGICELEKPDKKSRTPDEEGRRITRIDQHRDWGWKLVNHEHYKKLASWEEKKEKDRIRIQEKRAAEKTNKIKGVAECRNPSQPVVKVAHTYTDTYTDTNTKKKNIYKKKNENLQKEKTQKKQIKKTEWPNDFVLDDKKRAYAIEHNIDENKLEDFFLDFKDWSLQHGAIYKDWDAAFRNRVRKAPEFGKQFLTSGLEKKQWIENA